MDPSNERNWEEFQVRSVSLGLKEETTFPSLFILPAQCLGLGLLTFGTRPLNCALLLLQLMLVHFFTLALAEACRKQHQYTLPGVVEAALGERWRHAMECVLIAYTFSTMVLAQLLLSTALITALLDVGVVSEGDTNWWHVVTAVGICVLSGLASCYTTVSSMGTSALVACALSLFALFVQVLQWSSNTHSQDYKVDFNLLSLHSVHAMSLSMSWAWLFPFLQAEKQYSALSLTNAASWTLGGLFVPAIFILPNTRVDYNVVTPGSWFAPVYKLALLPSLVLVSAFSLYVCRMTTKQLIGGVKVFKSPILYYGLTVMFSFCAAILLAAIPEVIPQLLFTQVVGFFVVTFVAPAVLAGMQWMYCGVAFEVVLLLLD